MYLVLRTHRTYLYKANRIDALIYYRLSVPFLHVDIVKNRYDREGPITLPKEMYDNLLKEVSQFDVQTLRVNLVMQREPDGLLPYDKIFRYENILMLRSGLVDELKIFPELL